MALVYLVHVRRFLLFSRQFILAKNGSWKFLPWPLFFSNLGKALIHIVGFGLLSAGTSKLLLQALETQKFNIIIIDESHYLKTRGAARTQRLHQLCKKAKHAILLSGTPSLARPREVCWFCPAIKLSKVQNNTIYFMSGHGNKSYNLISS